MKINISDTDIEKAMRYAPITVKRRLLIVDSIVAELNNNNFRALDETNAYDVECVMEIISRMYPTVTRQKMRDYAQTSIRVRKLQKINKK